MQHQPNFPLWLSLYNSAPQNRRSCGWKALFSGQRSLKQEPPGMLSSARLPLTDHNSPVCVQLEGTHENILTDHTKRRVLREARGSKAVGLRIQAFSVMNPNIIRRHEKIMLTSLKMQQSKACLFKLQLSKTWKYDELFVITSLITGLHWSFPACQRRPCQTFS